MFASDPEQTRSTRPSTLHHRRTSRERGSAGKFEEGCQTQLPQLIGPHIFADKRSVSIQPPKWGSASGVRRAPPSWDSPAASFKRLGAEALRPSPLARRTMPLDLLKFTYASTAWRVRPAANLLFKYADYRSQEVEVRRHKPTPER